MTAIDPNLFESGLRCGVMLGALGVALGALGMMLGWQIVDAIKARKNRPPVNEDWPEDRQ